MGNDGGSIPNRRDLVKEKEKRLTSSQLFESKQLNVKDLWTRCALSDNLLQDPIVSDYKGRLYNKEAILEWLLSPERFPEVQQSVVKHIKSLKDVVDLQIVREDKTSRWICPISRKDIVAEAAATRIIYVAECGHVFTESTIRQVEGNNCLMCETKYDSSNVILLNPDQDDDKRKLEERKRKLTSQGLSHSLKNSKKKSKRKDLETTVVEEKKIKKILV